MKTLYRELGLEGVYREYEDSSYQQLMTLIDAESAASGLPRKLFVEFANRIYKRKT